MTATGMKCPHCGCRHQRVVNSRALEEGAMMYRRRECLVCSKRWTTTEMADCDMQALRAVREALRTLRIVQPN